MDDEDWQPPSEAEMKLIQAKRDRSDKISKLMSGYLLKGYKMLGSVCSACDTILLQDRQGANYCVSCSELDSDTDKDNPLTNHSAAQSLVKEREFSTSTVTGASNIEPKDLIKSTPQVFSQWYQSPAAGDAATRPKVPPASTEAIPPHPSNPEPQTRFPMPGTEQGAVAALELSIKQEIAPTDTDSCDSGFPLLAEPRTSSLPQQRKRPASVSRPMFASSLPESSSVEFPVSRLFEKMDWASRELKDTASVEYSIQLCQLIKAAAEALIAVRNARM